MFSVNWYPVIFLYWLLFQSTIVAAQDIQWCSKVEYFYNAYSEQVANEITGPPDAYPWGELSERAFRLKETAGFGTIVATFPNPQSIKQLVIIENNHPGNIQDIVLYDDEGNSYDIYIGTQDVGTMAYRVFCIGMSPTSYKVKKVKVNLNTTENSGWSQLDAIGIAYAESSESVMDKLKVGESNFDYQPSFASGKVRLSTYINSPYPEIKPIISPDGKTLYFSRHHHPDNIGGKRDKQDIYYSVLINNQWTPAKNMGAPLNNLLPNGLSSISPDGNKILLINTYENVFEGNMDAAISYKANNTWTDPKPLEIEGFLNKSEFTDFYLGHSGKVLLMAIQDDRSIGDQDLYVSFLAEDDTWTRPVNLGATVNTTGAEFSPFLAADGTTLYFASTGHEGMGASDIFYTKRLDDSWSNWSAPVNMGPAVNSKGWDAYYSISAAGDIAYFVFGDPRDKSDRDIFQIELPKEFKPDPVLLIKGKVLDSITKEPVAAKVFFESLGTGEERGIAFSDDITGRYQLILQRGQSYGYLAEAPGYISINEQIDLQEIDSYREIEQDLYLIPIKIGQIFTLNNVLFEQSTANILPQSFPELNRLYSILERNPTLKIEVGGHTDNVGLKSANLRLSKERAEVVRQYLIDQGISPKQVSYAYYGGSRPVASNLEEETRKLNRRVEVKILDYSPPN